MDGIFMDGFTIGEIIAGVTVVVGNVVGLKWLRSDLKKQDDKVALNTADIKRLFEKVDKTMTRQETKEMVTEVVGLLREDYRETKESIDKMQMSVDAVKEKVVRIDERNKVQNEHAHL